MSRCNLFYNFSPKLDSSFIPAIMGEGEGLLQNYSLVTKGLSKTNISQTGGGVKVSGMRQPFL